MYTFVDKHLSVGADIIRPLKILLCFIFCNLQAFGVAEKEMPLKIWSPFSLPVEILPILSRTSPRFIRHGRRFGDVPLEREPKRLVGL